MKDWRGPLIALVILAVVGGVYLLWEPAEPAHAPEPGQEEDLTITSLDWEKIRAVGVRWLDTPELRIEREPDGRFQLTSPEARATDQDRARLLFRSAAEMRAARVVAEEDEADPADYGLDDPRRQIIIEMVDGTDIVVEVGDDSPIALDEYTSRYARLADGGDIFLVQGSRLDFYTAPFERWRDDRILRKEDIREISVTAARGTWVAEKTEAPFAWEVIEPYPVPADGAILDRFAREMRSMRINEFYADEPSREQLEELALIDGNNRVTVRGADGSTVTIIIGKFVDPQGSEVYVRREDIDEIYICSTGFYSAPGFSDVREWIADRPFALAPRDRIQEVSTVNEEGAREHLVRTEDGWHLKARDGSESDYERREINAVLDDLRSFSLRDILWPNHEEATVREAFEAETTTITVAYGQPGDTRDITLTFAPSIGDGRAYAKMVGYDVTYVFGEDILAHVSLEERIEEAREQ